MRYRACSENLFGFAYSIYKELKGLKKPIFLCVGSDKFVFDSLAPIVAEKLKKEYDIPMLVYGGLSYNINANNLMEAVNYIETMHDGSSIILIDATLDKNVGEIVVTKGAFAGRGRCIPNRKIGDLSILGVVGRKVANFNLNSTSMSLIVSLADFIARGCFLAVNKIQKENFSKRLGSQSMCSIQ